FQDNRDNQCIDNFRNKFSSNFAAFGAVYYPWVNASVVPLSELSFRNIHSESIDDFVNLLTLDALNRYPAPKKQQSVIDEINKLKDLAQLNEADADQLHKTLNVILPL